MATFCQVFGGHYGNFKLIKNFQDKCHLFFVFSSAKKEGKVPDKGGHAVGLERFEILCRMEGKVRRVSIRLNFVLLTNII